MSDAVSAQPLVVSARPLKVVRVIARLNIGGPARHVVLLDRGLRDRGHRTLLVHGSLDAGEGSLEHLALESGIPTLKIPELGRSIRLLGDVKAFSALIRLLFRESPDIVHTHTAKAGAVGRLAAFLFNLTRGRGRRCAVIHTFHGHVLSGYFGPAGSLLARVAERRLAAITDRVVTISPGLFRDLVTQYSICPESRAAMIPLGLDLQPLLSGSAAGQGLRRQLGIDERSFVVGYVGRFVPIKDLGTLIRAVAQAAQLAPEVALVLAGDGPRRPEMEELVGELAIRDRVRFLGWREDLPLVYDTCDICAISSLNEGTPVSIIEAMAAGKAVVATQVGGVPDIVKQQTGLIVPPRDVAALADAIVRLATHPEERHRMGAAARIAAARFSEGRLVQDVERLYSSVLAETRG